MQPSENIYWERKRKALILQTTPMTGGILYINCNAVVVEYSNIMQSTLFETHPAASSLLVVDHLSLTWPHVGLLLTFPTAQSWFRCSWVYSTSAVLLPRSISASALVATGDTTVKGQLWSSSPLPLL